MAFLWLTMMVALWVVGRGKLRTLLIAAGTFLAMLVPLAVWFYLHPQTYLDTYGRWAIFAAHLRNPIDGFLAFMNRNTLGTRASAYWRLLDPSYLFFTSARSTAPLLMVSAPLIVAGIVRCARLAPNAPAIVMLAGLVVAPLAGSSFGEPQYIALALGLLPFPEAVATGYAMPLLATGFAALLLGERFTPLMLLGAALILIAILTVQLAPTATPRLAVGG